MTTSANSESVTYAKASGVKTAAETGDRIEHVKLSLAFLPLATPVSDAKVLTGRQKPLTEVAIIIAEIRSRDGFEGVGFSYSKRAGGQGIYAHAKEIADNLLQAAVIKSTAAFTSVVNANSTTLYPGTFTLKKHMAASKVIDVLSDTNQAAGFLEVRPGERATDVFANAA